MLHLGKGRPLPERVKGRHERISLLPTLGLQNGMGVARLIMPNKLGGAGVKQPHERQASIGPGHAVKTCEHRVARDGVKSSDTINGQYAGCGVELDRCCQCMHNRIDTRAGGQGELVGAARIVEGGRKLLSQSARNQAPQEVTDNDAPDAPRRFGQRNDPAEAEGPCNHRGNRSFGKLLGDTDEAIRVGLIIQN